jgi:hypothetical protein
MALSAGVVTGWAKLSGPLIRWRLLNTPDADEGSRGLLGGGSDGGASVWADGEAVILFVGRFSPRIKVLGTGGGEFEPSCGGGAATPAAATDGYSVAAAAGDGSDG